VPVRVAFRFCRIRKAVHQRFSDLDAKRRCRALPDVSCRAVLLVVVVVVLLCGMLPDQKLGLCLVPILPWTESLYVLSDEYLGGGMGQKRTQESRDF
jgi:hypothetical protein